MSVTIEPNVLEYNSPLTETSTNYITIENHTEDVKAFKIKTTAPKLYCVRPNAAIIEPGETVKVSVIFLGLSEEPQDYKCKDKFLVIVLPAPYELESGRAVSDVWNDLEAEFKSESIQKKIRVVYNGPANDIAAAPIVSSTSESVSEANKHAEATTTTEEESKVPSKQEETGPAPLDKEVPPAEKVLRPTTASPSQTSSSSSTKMEPPLQTEQQDLNNTISPSTMLFIAIIAIALGWLYY